MINGVARLGDLKLEGGKFSVLITGANGFIGQSLCAEMSRQNWRVTAAVRCERKSFPPEVQAFIVGEIDSSTNWNDGLNNIDVIIHLAARAHVLKEKNPCPIDEFRRVNAVGTEHLARCAAAAGVRRLVYVSTIGVNGLQTSLGRPFIETNTPSPHNPYAISKWEAEQALQRVAQETGLEVVIVRPPLVYGVGAPGNFEQMLKFITKGIPLPLAAVQNLRSFIYVENLVDALITCANHPSAAGQTYLVSDGEDVSTSELLQQLGEAMGHPAQLFSCPSVLLKLAGRLIGKTDQVERLLGSLRVDSGKIRRELDWCPPYTLREGLRKTGNSVRNIVY